MIGRQERDPHLALVWQHVVGEVRLQVEAQLAAGETEGPRDHLAVSPFFSLHCHEAVERRLGDADFADAAIAQLQQRPI